MVNYDLDITNILALSPQIRYIEVFGITNPPFNEQIWPVPSDLVKSRFHCTMITNYHTLLSLASSLDVNKEFSQHAIREIVC